MVFKHELTQAALVTSMMMGQHQRALRRDTKPEEAPVPTLDPPMPKPVIIAKVQEANYEDEAQQQTPEVLAERKKTRNKRKAFAERHKTKNKH